MGNRISETVGALLGRCLAAAGAARVFGSPDSGISGIPGLSHVHVGEPSLATLLADAAGRLGRGPGVALLPGRRLHLGSAPGVRVEVPLVLDDVAELPLTVASWDAGHVHAATELVLDFDLDAPVPPGIEPVTLKPAGRAMTLSPSMHGVRMVVLAGPGVARSASTEALRAASEQLGVGVALTWGAEGLVPSDSPRYFGTVGLQERDFDLAGLPDAQVVIATGIDEAEAPRSRWATGQVLDVEPWQLPALALNWPEPAHLQPRPALCTDLEAALQPLLDSVDVPLSPARAVAELGEMAALTSGLLVAADPGPAGFWVARSLRATEPGNVVVPATMVRGFAAAAAVVSSLDGRACVGVTTAAPDPETHAMLELARVWGAAVVVEVWGDDGQGFDREGRLSRTLEAVRSGGVHVLPVPVDFSLTRVMVEVAGPIVAWSPESG